MNFLRHLRNLVQIMQLPEKFQNLTFYSEGESDWPHLKGLIEGILLNTDTSICYITSSPNDPGLSIQHPNLKSFQIDKSFIRNWLFENIKTDVLVMTMPDLNQFQVKLSKHTVHYVYIQHSLNSLHMAYRKGAFDYFDTVFCAGPHHIMEINAMEDYYNLPRKQIVKHGYGRLDSITEEESKRNRAKRLSARTKRILIAPSWGENAAIESGVAEVLIGKLIEQNFHVTLRPHPQTLNFTKN